PRDWPFGWSEVFSVPAPAGWPFPALASFPNCTPLGASRRDPPDPAPMRAGSLLQNVVSVGKKDFDARSRPWSVGGGGPNGHSRFSGNLASSRGDYWLGLHRPHARSYRPQSSPVAQRRYRSHDEAWTRGPAPRMVRGRLEHPLGSQNPSRRPISRH